MLAGSLVMVLALGSVLVGAVLQPSNYLCGVCLATAEQQMMVKDFDTPIRMTCNNLFPAEKELCAMFEEKHTFDLPE
jgi:hypothetical protein